MYTGQVTWISWYELD